MSEPDQEAGCAPGPELGGAHIDAQDAAAWFAAVQSPRVCAALQGVYAEVAAAVAARTPVCSASGRCCDFDVFGHLLFTTGLEAAYTLQNAVRTQGAGSAPEAPAQGVRLPMFSASADGAGAPAVGPYGRGLGGCPYQIDGLCSVHTIKPLGCRVYYCDPSAQAWQEQLHERLLGDVRSLHGAHGLPYRYGEWRTTLRRLAPFVPGHGAC